MTRDSIGSSCNTIGDGKIMKNQWILTTLHKNMERLDLKDTMWSSLVARFSRAPCFESPSLALQYQGCQLTNCKLATWRSLYWHGPRFKMFSNVAAILYISLGICFRDLRPLKSNFLLEPRVKFFQDNEFFSNFTRILSELVAWLEHRCRG